MEEQPQVSKEEQIGFHKGALATLAKEREEMVKIVQIVEQLMQAHLKGLKDLGVDLEAEAKKAAEIMKKAQEQKQPGEDIADRLGQA
ncbi:MAG: hypothetical protein KKA79_07685 [Nanoarchaeota archaeon]|nr:hypothetical protein [Nanoarchaeota archaeon]MCG2717284.1 hypothetical protein [Nanoarchaeota archaeon]